MVSHLLSDSVADILTLRHPELRRYRLQLFVLTACQFCRHADRRAFLLWSFVFHHIVSEQILTNNLPIFVTFEIYTSKGICSQMFHNPLFCCRRAVVWSGWPFIEIRLNQHTAQCVGSCYLVKCAYVRASPALALHPTPPIYILLIYIVGWGWCGGRRWGNHQYGASSLVASNGISSSCFGLTPL